MSASPDITVTIVFHREGALAIPALASMRDLVDTARAAGLTVESRAVLDLPDDLTRHIVASRGDFLAGVAEIAAGDPGHARNAGVASALGEFLAFLDGDDLWGADWLRLAHSAATASDAPGVAIWHPESLYFFYESDFDHHSLSAVPTFGAQSFHRLHRSSDAADFDPDTLFLHNAWTANAFTPREVHLRHPYSAMDRARGLGIEDWTWNIETVYAGIPHRVVRDTVHLIRVKEAGSLGRQHAADGLLPRLPHGAWPKLRGWELK